MILQWISALFLGYIFGCFQTSYFISKWVKKTDIRTMGSGNAGASNVTATMGVHFGFITGIIDMLKAYLAVIAIAYLFPESSALMDLKVLGGSAAIMGHIFPFFMNFKGGKGIACYLGMLLAIDWIVGINIIVFLLVMTVITDFVAVGSILIYILVPLFVLIYTDYSLISFVIFLIVGMVGIFKHWINVKRMLTGEEFGLRSAMRKEHLQEKGEEN